MKEILSSAEVDALFDVLDHADGSNSTIANKRAPNTAPPNDEAKFRSIVVENAERVVGRLISTARLFAAK